jgi:dTDP-glucose pyrophosphorylase
MKPTLLVLAAGIGSRYGGLKQIDPVGPHGEVILDFSVHDAIRAGFGKVVFVIRRDIEQPFRDLLGRRFESRLPVEYAFQELDALPPGFTVPPGRVKPWGTGHAILVAEPHIREPFAAINADDFYGAASFQVLADYLQSGATDYAMVGFTLRNTLSEHGSVARGVCRVDDAGHLREVVELLKIFKAGPGARSIDEAGQEQSLTGNEPVSMNLWGFTPSVFGHLRRMFTEFLQLRGREEKSEFLIPRVVDTLVKEGRAKVQVLPTNAAWFGVTYQADKPVVAAAIQQLIARGDYPRLT